MTVPAVLAPEQYTNTHVPHAGTWQINIHTCLGSTYINTQVHTHSTRTVTLMTVTMANTGKLMRGKHGALWNLKALYNQATLNRTQAGVTYAFLVS